jgi:hypothetical protein
MSLTYEFPQLWNAAVMQLKVYMFIWSTYNANHIWWLKGILQIKESQSMSTSHHRHKTHITMFKVLTNKWNIQCLLENIIFIATELSHVCRMPSTDSLPYSLWGTSWQFETARLIQALSW